MIVENEILELFPTCLVVIQNSTMWLLDLECTRHMTPHKEWCHEHIPLIELHVVYMGDGRVQYLLLEL